MRLAFGLVGREGKRTSVVVDEIKAEDPINLRQAVAGRILQAVGLAAAETVLVAPCGVPKTSSGKVQRSLSQPLPRRRSSRVLADRLRGLGDAVRAPARLRHLAWLAVPALPPGWPCVRVDGKAYSVKGL